mgnify:CR=1 FL=1
MQYFMISIDDPQTNKEFAESLNADFPLLSDPGKGVASAYGVINDERPVPFRWTFIIGPGTGPIWNVWEQRLRKNSTWLKRQALLSVN